MGQYGTVALDAYQLAIEGMRPEAAWWQAIEQLESASSRGKSCPRTTFIALCEFGMLAGVAGSPNTMRMTPNKQYVQVAVDMLRGDPATAEKSHAEFWHTLMINAGEQETKKPNRQVDVILTLWGAGAITRSTSVIPSTSQVHQP